MAAHGEFDEAAERKSFECQLLAGGAPERLARRHNGDYQNKYAQFSWLAWNHRARIAHTALTEATARIRVLEAANDRLRLSAFAPVGDNHHNAARCPYCNPALSAPPDTPTDRQDGEPV